MLPGGEPGGGTWLSSSSLLWKIHIVLDYKRRERLNPFILLGVFFPPFLDRENLKLAACLAKSPTSLQTQLFCAGLLSDKPALFCFSDSLSLHPTIFEMSLFFPIFTFPPSALNCCCGLQDLNAQQLCCC